MYPRGFYYTWRRRPLGLTLQATYLLRPRLCARGQSATSQTPLEKESAIRSLERVLSRWFPQGWQYDMTLGKLVSNTNNTNNNIIILIISNRPAMIEGG